MTLAVRRRSDRQVVGEELADALVDRASPHAIAIRDRLAAVAAELRGAAAVAGSGNEHLMRLADKLEFHARAGDTQ